MEVVTFCIFAHFVSNSPLYQQHSDFRNFIRTSIISPAVRLLWCHSLAGVKHCIELLCMFKLKDSLHFLKHFGVFQGERHYLSRSDHP